MIKQVTPRISICIPTYNYGRFIGDSLASALNQTLRDLEVVVVDNCSTDDTAEFVERFAKTDPRVRYYCNEKNVGMVGNWNRCLELARGEFVTILCADDVLSPGFVEQTIDFLDRHHDAVLVATARHIVAENLDELEILSTWEGERVEDGALVICKCLVEGNLVGEPTAVVFRRRATSRGFLPKYHHLTDLEMWLHLLEKGKFGYLPTPLCSIRRHGAQETISSIASLSFIDDEFTLYDDYIERDYVGFSYLLKKKLLFLKNRVLWSFHTERDEAELKEKISRRSSFVLFLILYRIKQLADLAKGHHKR